MLKRERIYGIATRKLQCVITALLETKSILISKALEPPRNGLQRAVFDEVDDISGLVGEITQKNDIDAYDDKFVDLRGEDPLFIPKPYRDEKEEQTGTKVTTKNSPLSFTTLARIPPAKSTGRTSAPVHLAMRLPLSSQSSPVRLSTIQPLPQREFPSFFPPRIVDHKSEMDLQTPLLLSQLPQSMEHPQQHRISLISSTRATIPPRPTQTISSIQTITPHSQLLHPQIDLPPPSHSTSDSLRTGVCRASIFYISTAISSSQKHSFTHFAITVSTDQCARTCHEFNCAIAHYNPDTGHCQFNPSTAFSVRKGQCPPWPATHYKNNVQSSAPLRIFCVQCHRSFRRGQLNNRGNRFRTAVLKTLYTGRLPSSLRRSGVARAHTILSKQSDVIMESPFSNTTLKLEKQYEWTAGNKSSEKVVYE
ncbi:hypothetical protein DINM_005181 [Dirofilaria immitis]|nr:hypothetical protein [Dirofilaria immitis]